MTSVRERRNHLMEVAKTIPCRHCHHHQARKQTNLASYPASNTAVRTTGYGNVRSTRLNGGRSSSSCTMPNMARCMLRCWATLLVEKYLMAGSKRFSKQESWSNFLLESRCSPLIPKVTTDKGSAVALSIRVSI